jgi:signal transduction histidine kinase/ligand-binding sensor domain-containing protein
MREARRLAPCGVALGMLLVCPGALALNPALDVSQYAHTSWKIRDGFVKGLISSIAQTPDGYLWLGTEFGLIRFDGVKRVPWQPPTDQHLPSSLIIKLLTARDGTLWIGTRTGLASWKDGKLIDYPALTGFTIVGLLEDRDGSIWAGSISLPNGRLCQIQKASVRCFSTLGDRDARVFGLHQDGRGNLWIGSLKGLWRWQPPASEFYPIPDQPDGIQGMAEDENGALLIASKGGVRRLEGGKAQVAYSFPAAIRELSALRMLRDRDGGLWIGTIGGGIVHIHGGRTDVFSASDGLSGANIGTIYEDREGNIWIATTDGLDRFGELPAVRYSTSQGLSNGLFGAVLAAKDGSIWIGTSDGLDRLSDGRTVSRQGGGSARDRGREIPGFRLSSPVASLFEDSRERIWISTLASIGHLEKERFVATAAPGGPVHAMTEDASGNLWIANQNVGLLMLSPNHEFQRLPWAALGREDPAYSLAADPSQGGVWLGYYKGGIAWFRDGRVRASYSAADWLGSGHVSDLRFDRQGVLWAATSGGLSRLKDGRIATLTSRNGLPCDAVHWTLEDDAPSVWLAMPCGLVRIARSDLDGWARAPDQVRRLATTVFDTSDGLRMGADAGGYTPHAGKAPDGKLWFVVRDGIAVVDPRHLPFNKVPPSVHVEKIIADGKKYWDNLSGTASTKLRLPALMRDLEINYTALSLVNAERVRFRYKLEGHDPDWREDVENRRQVTYNDLAPRSYRFRVIACNNNGVWNEAGASLDFSVAPALYQTTWFQALCVIAAGALTWMLYRLRLRQVSARINMLHNERLAERTRIARDLHDTLLQSLAGVSLQLHGISKTAATAPEKTPSQIDRIRQQVDAAFREARMKVHDLRSPAVEGKDLTEALSDFIQRLGPTATARCTLHVTGEPLACRPEIREELLRIAEEAANNANRHAGAKEIRIAVEYRAESVKLSISDDGAGFHLEEGLAKTGHWGLKNMQERAAQLRGKCSITSAPGHGTQIEVHVPLGRSR